MKSHNQKIIDIILFILDRIKDEKLTWVLTESANLLIQDIDVNANDIDILITKKDAYRFYNLFKEFGLKEIEYSATDKFRSFFSKLIINEISIEIITRLEYKSPDNVWRKSTLLKKRKLIEYNSYIIPVNPLENEIAFYQLMKRKKDFHKIELIKKALENMNNSDK